MRKPSAIITKDDTPVKRKPILKKAKPIQLSADSDISLTYSEDTTHCKPLHPVTPVKATPEKIYKAKRIILSPDAPIKEEPIDGPVTSNNPSSPVAISSDADSLPEVDKNTYISATELAADSTDDNEQVFFRKKKVKISSLVNVRYIEKEGKSRNVKEFQTLRASQRKLWRMGLQ